MIDGEYMKNRKGFTLIELLVCITILGIIMGMSIPVIRNITVKNSATKYSSYLDTVVHAAKLYVDSYGDDLFGYNDFGCSYVSFEDLLEKGLIKDYNSDGITCNTTSTYVEVTKYEDSYSYKGYLGCASKSDVYNLIYTLPELGTPNYQDPATCAGIDVNSSISITLNPRTSDDVTKKNLDVKVKINGRFGIAPGFELKYKWSKSDIDLNTNGMQTAGFSSVPAEAAQRHDVSLGKMISIESDPISTPLGESGKLYFIVYSDSLADLYGTPWSYNESIYVVYGPFTVDNSPPSFDATSAIVSTHPSYNNDSPRLSLSVNDDVSSQNDLQMCVSYSGFCNDWEKFDANKELPSISGFQYNGSNYKVYVAVKDAAGNIAQKEFNYKSYVSCTVQIDDGDWEGDCPKCGANVEITQTKSKRDAYIGTICSSESRQYTCSVPGCCTSTTIECSDWGDYSSCSRECGIGTKKRTRTCKNISTYNGTECDDVIDTSLTEQIVECNTQGCAPMFCTGSAYSYDYHSCDSTSEYKNSRKCTVGFNSKSSICITYQPGKKVDNVSPTLSCRITATSNEEKFPKRDWFTNCENQLSTLYSYDLEMRVDNGNNYNIKGGVTSVTVETR